MAAANPVSIGRIQKLLAVAMHPNTNDNEALAALRRVPAILTSNGLDVDSLGIASSVPARTGGDADHLRAALRTRETELARKDLLLNEARRRAVAAENEVYERDQTIVSLNTRLERIVRRGVSLRRAVAGLNPTPVISKAPAAAVPKAKAPRTHATRAGRLPFSALQEACERLNQGTKRWEVAFYRVTGTDQRNVYQWRKRGTVPEDLVQSLRGYDWSVTHPDAWTRKKRGTIDPAQRRPIKEFFAHGDAASGGRIDWKDVFCAHYGITRADLAGFNPGIRQEAFDLVDRIDWAKESVRRVPYADFDAQMRAQFPDRYFRTRYVEASSDTFSIADLDLWKREGSVPVEAMAVFTTLKPKRRA